MSKIRSLSTKEIESLRLRLNAYAGRLDIPASVEGLHVEIIGDVMRTSYRLTPTGNMDARKWSAMNKKIEKMIQKFITDGLTGE